MSNSKPVKTPRKGQQGSWQQACESWLRAGCLAAKQAGEWGAVDFKFFQELLSQSSLS